MNVGGVVFFVDNPDGNFDENIFHDVLGVLGLFVRVARPDGSCWFGRFFVRARLLRF